MAFVTDTFTDTDGVSLFSHVGEVGASYTELFAGPDPVIAANRIRGATAYCVGYASGVPGSAEYDVEWDYYVADTTIGSDVFGRLLTSAVTGYMVEISNGNISLYGASNGTFSGLGSYNFTTTVGATIHVKLEIRTAAKKVYIDGVERISSANDDHTGAGRVGLGLAAATDTTSFHVDNLSGTDLAVAGPTFDAVSNSGYNAASSTDTWSHVNAGNFLIVGVPMLGLANVTTVTFNGKPLARLAPAVTSDGSLLRIELWGMTAPDVGTFDIVVTLDGSIAWAGVASSWSGVHQISPVEAFNSATATNVGAADATVAVTTVADNCVVVDVMATSDGSVTVGAGQTSRNNVTGAAGSGTMSSEGPKTPAGSVTMSWTDVGALATWVIGAIALRPIAAAPIGRNSRIVNRAVSTSRRWAIPRRQIILPAIMFPPPWQGPLSPGTAVSTAPGTTAWVNPGNVFASDNARAVATLTALAITEHLKATNFVFTIPSGATILGIVAGIEMSRSIDSGAPKDNTIKLIKGGVVGGTNKAKTGAWPATDTYRTYGTPTDLWGESWTPSDINASDFGIAVAAEEFVDGNVEARIDHIRITVYYTGGDAAVAFPEILIHCQAVHTASFY